MAVVACLQHLEEPFTGHAGQALAAHGLEVREFDLRGGARPPPLDEVDAIVSFGGEQSATELERYPYLVEEAELLRAAVAAEVPVLGVCLGAQLLARALGGSVSRMPRRMVEWVEVERLPAALEDPVFAGLPSPLAALHWNEDCLEPPPEAVELLERAGPGAEAYRVGRWAWGVQFHAEVDGQVLERWYEEWGRELGEAGVEEARARAADRRHLPRQRETAHALFGAFADVVARRAATG